MGVQGYGISLQVFNSISHKQACHAADWLSQTHVKNYCNFLHVVIRFFSVVEIPIKLPSLYKNSFCSASYKMGCYL